MFFRKLILFIFIMVPTIASSQANQSSEKINVFVDCRDCGRSFRGGNEVSYIRNEIKFVNFVRDQGVAQVHLLITKQRTGGGGGQYTLNFIGQDDLASESQELTYSSSGSATEDESRKGLLNKVKIGLLSYMTGSNALEDLSIEYAPTEEREVDPIDDNWNNWVFEVGAGTNFNGEESRKGLNMNSDFSIRRITEKWKTFIYSNYRYNRRTFVSEDSLGNKEEDIYTTERMSLFGLTARSLSSHWTLGSFIRLQSSTRDNYDLRVALTPSIEYSVFPYREHTQRQITFRYGVMNTFNNYTETTIFGKDDEFLLQQELQSSMDFTQPWGEIEARMNASSYLHDLSKNRLEFDFEIDFRISKNLSVSFSTNYAVINDQINIAAGNTTDEELLLNLRQQSTSYSYGGSIGFEITFGSIYNNVVNPRF
ncbi:MAG: hypothetical protein FH748_16250 [Balneolaceae bacterium]|nr:hypothetical protein [Balneolaceae bacterium]